jgi:hydrogenase 3 maturation protease
MKNIFKKILKGKVVIVGIGNTMRGDDSFGPVLIERLKGNIEAICINAGTSPENFTNKITREKPNTILIIDAVHLGLEAGEYKILQDSDIVKSGFTTHDISPSLFIEYLKQQTRADIYMLGVQPKNISFGAEMTPSLKKTIERLKKMIKESKNA